MEFKNKEIWDKAVEVNKDDFYGKGIIDFANRWALLMEAEIAKGFKVADIAHETSNKADTDGITGFMYGMAVTLLSESWKYGDELAAWHNNKYNHKGDGIANPAVVII